MNNLIIEREFFLFLDLCIIAKEHPSSKDFNLSVSLFLLHTM